MIKGLIRWSLANRLAVLLVSAILLLAGTYVTVTMPVDVFPDLTAPTVTVIVEGHGMAPEEMETLVTFPIETAVNGAADVRRVRSATAVVGRVRVGHGYLSRPADGERTAGDGGGRSSPAGGASAARPRVVNHG